MATGGGIVAFGTELRPGGDFWKPGTDQLAAARHDERRQCSRWRRTASHVVAIDGNQSADAFDTQGSTTHLSDFGFPFGAAANADYAVFPVAVDSLPGGVSEAIGGRMVDTDLYLYSFETGKIYSPLEERGQQGFPSISGDRLVWQDGVFGGDDIMEVTLPSRSLTPASDQHDPLDDPDLVRRHRHVLVVEAASRAQVEDVPVARRAHDRHAVAGADDAPGEHARSGRTGRGCRRRGPGRRRPGRWPSSARARGHSRRRSTSSSASRQTGSHSSVGLIETPFASRHARSPC